MKLNRQTILLYAILIIVSTTVKLICAPQLVLSGFSAVIAIALFSGLMIEDKKMAFLLPLLALFISDVLIQVLHLAKMFPFAGFYGGQLLNYSLFILITGIGVLLKKMKKGKMVLAIISGPTLFFLVSNFMVWQSDTTHTYAHNSYGLFECYGAGIPFYRNSLIATLIFLPSFVILYDWMVNGRPFKTLSFNTSK